MTVEVNATHDPAKCSWVGGANDRGTDFPIQNLPFGVFRTGGDVRGGVALGNCIIDLAALVGMGILSGGALHAARAASGSSLAPLLTVRAADISALRAQLFRLYGAGTDGNRAELGAALVPMSDAQLQLPMKPAAFTDFCTDRKSVV